MNRHVELISLVIMDNSCSVECSLGGERGQSIR